MNFESEFEFESNKSRPSLISAKLDLISLNLLGPSLVNRRGMKPTVLLKEREGGSTDTNALKSTDERSGRKLKPKIFTENLNFRSWLIHLKPLPEKAGSCAGIAVPVARARLCLASAVEHLLLSPRGRPSLEEASENAATEDTQRPMR